MGFPERDSSMIKSQVLEADAPGFKSWLTQP